MKKLVVMLAGLGIAAAALPAQAAPWQNINQRQAQIEARINQGIRTGALDRREAYRLRAEFRAIAQLETRYRMSRPGLTPAEYRDLDRRLDSLSRMVQLQKHDRQGRFHRS